ncbi:unnamed protein product [Adineta ricciae]|uniref:NAD(P)(+)--arginine ADP-ribosyltransferase n=1 Tax=Adineta ricciae TaxID=249248 RepID=A0A813PYK9_ADIRI|nr:unnamed protein product [Adineta ricciae]CAF1254513.1 unnamed protein product [Adineta ricciae]
MASNFLNNIQTAGRFSDVWLEPLRILPLIQNYEHLPIVPLDEAIQPIKLFVPELDRMVWIAKQHSQHMHGHLTLNESASILLYSMEWTPGENSFYYSFNQILRSENRELLKPWLLYFKLLLISYFKLPEKSISMVYRAVNMDLSSKYHTGSTCIWWGFSPCTMSAEYADRFLNKTGQRTLFKIECQSAKAIHEHTLSSNQEEVLFLPARQFKVIGNYQHDNDLCIIHLREIQPLISFFQRLSTIDMFMLAIRWTSDYTNSKLEHYIEHCKSRSEIKLENQSLNDSDMDIIVRQAINHKNCTALTLNHNQITCKGVFILGSVLYDNTTLTKLVLAKNSIGDLGIQYLSQILATNHVHTSKLDLSSNKITCKSIQYLSEMLKTNEILCSLWLNENEITDEGVYSLVNSLAFYNRSLKFLRLSGDPTITDASVDSIINMLEHNTALKFLDIQHCNLSSGGKLSLEKAIRSKKSFYLLA